MGCRTIKARVHYNGPGLCRKSAHTRCHRFGLAGGNRFDRIVDRVVLTERFGLTKVGAVAYTGGGCVQAIFEILVFSFERFRHFG